MFVHDYNFSQNKILYYIAIWKQREANAETDWILSAFASLQRSSQKPRNSKVSCELQDFSTLSQVKQKH